MTKASPVNERSPSRFIYTPDQDIRVHEEGAIRLICAAFQSHENGLPEWAKNAADEYARQDAPEQRRVIFLIFDYGRRNVPTSISCLDFGGMTSRVIEENFRIWADPEAAARGTRTSAVQGGHGNGGKCYMTQMFEQHSLLHTVKKGKRCRYGVRAGSVRFGYIPDRALGKDQPVGDLRAELSAVLAPIRCSVDRLEEVASEALRVADGFTLATGFGSKGYGNRIPMVQLLESLQSHHQMIRTLELCEVYVVVNGELFNQGRPLALPEIDPMAGAEEPRVIEVLEKLPDPMSEQEVSTTNDGQLVAGELVLRTSDVSMRWSKKLRHTIAFKARSGYIGFVLVPELDVQSPYAVHIYGDCILPALEEFKQNDRQRLADSPLMRAVLRWIGQEIQNYAREFEARDRRRYGQEEKNAISRMNDALDRWKNKFLNTVMQGLWGNGEGFPPPPPPLPSGKPATIELSLTHYMAGVGVSFRPVLKFFDRDGQRIRAVPFRWVSDDNNVAMVDEDLSIINTFACGETTIHAETLDGRVTSNSVSLSVVHIHDIRIEPPEIEVAAGSRCKLDAVCRLATEEEASGVLLVWTEGDPSVARVSSAGLAYGFAPGQTEVTAGDDRCMSRSPCIIKVVPGEGRGRGERRGRGYPKVLVSEIDPDPETGEAVRFGRDEPPVSQRPQDVDGNIWWINSAAPLARMYLDSTRGYGYETREWRMYHMERYIDVMVQIALTYGPEEVTELSAGDWILRWGSQVAEMQKHAASSLADFIWSGTLPGEGSR